MSIDRDFPEGIVREGISTKTVAGVAHALLPTILAAKPNEINYGVYLLSTAAEISAITGTVMGADPKIAGSVYLGSRLLAMTAESFHRASERRHNHTSKNESVYTGETFVNKTLLAISKTLLPTALSGRKLEIPLLQAVQAVSAASEAFALTGIAFGQISPELGGLVYGSSKLLSMVVEAGDKAYRKVWKKP